MKSLRLDRMIANMAERLAGIGIDTAKLDARLLARFGLGLSETDLILQFDRVLEESEQGQLEALLQRRLTKEPVAHILGEREFWGLRFAVTPDTLVPRPDSETLVAGVLDRIADHTAALFIVDIGTGSGCLLLSLLSELPNAVGLGTDISAGALTVAHSNAKALGLHHRCRFVCGDYAKMLSGGMDILISNPPYLAERELDDLEDDVAKYDPRRALVSGQTGLEAYRSLFESITNWDAKPSLVAFEFGYQQAAAINQLAKESDLSVLEDVSFTFLRDLGRRDRVLLIEMAQ